MIKANELRLGNWVLLDWENSYMRVNSNTLSYINRSEKLGKKHPFKPIPLTEEILLNCGFEKVRKYFQIDWFVIYKDKKGYYAHINCGNNYINNLHQLQNLYFALTNQELNIEL